MIPHGKKIVNAKDTVLCRLSSRIVHQTKMWTSISHCYYNYLYKQLQTSKTSGQPQSYHTTQKSGNCLVEVHIDVLLTCNSRTLHNCVFQYFNIKTAKWIFAYSYIDCLTHWCVWAWRRRKGYMTSFISWTKHSDKSLLTSKAHSGVLKFV